MKKISNFPLGALLLGVFLSFWSAAGVEKPLPVNKTDEGALLKPEKICGVENEWYVLDRGDETVKIYEQNGHYLGKIGGKGAGPGEFFFPVLFTVDPERIYVYDSGFHKIHIFSRKERKYLESRLFTLRFPGYDALSMSRLGKDGFVVSTCTLIKGQQAVAFWDASFKPVGGALDCTPVYDSEDAYFSAKKRIPEMYLNYGCVAAAGDRIYFVYWVRNQLIELNRRGDLLTSGRLPEPSIERELKIRTYADGGQDLEKRLNYDLKIINGRAVVLTRDKHNHSILYEFRDGVFKKRFSTVDLLTGFDEMNGVAGGIIEDEDAIRFYKIK